MEEIQGTIGYEKTTNHYNVFVTPLDGDDRYVVGVIRKIEGSNRWSFGPVNSNFHFTAENLTTIADFIRELGSAPDSAQEVPVDKAESTAFAATA